MNHLNEIQNISTNPIEVFLKVNDDFYTKFESNKDNNLKSAELQRIFEVQRKSYYQKYSPNDRGSRHRILIPFSDIRALELIVFLGRAKIDAFTDKFYYKVQKIKEISFYNSPKKDTVEKKSRFKLIKFSENDGSQEKDFQELYKVVENTNIPVADVNKEKDISIWKKLCFCTQTVGEGEGTDLEGH